MDQALYNCNWTVAPLRVKKLLLLYKIRMSKPAFIKGGPYFVMNWDMFGVVSIKKFYLNFMNCLVEPFFADLEEFVLRVDDFGRCAAVR